jgi:hypothetical protein
VRSISLCYDNFIFEEENYFIIAPDLTVLNNLRDVNPMSLLLPFHAANTEKDYLRSSSGKKQKTHKTTGPVHTYVKTDKKANVKWGVRHYVGKKYSK